MIFIPTFMQITLFNHTLLNLVYKAWKIRKYLSFMGSNFSCFSTSHMVSSLLQRLNNPEILKICSCKYGYYVSNNQFDFKIESITRLLVIHYLLTNI